jgi:hypothetical protein
MMLQTSSLATEAPNSEYGDISKLTTINFIYGTRPSNTFYGTYRPGVLLPAKKSSPRSRPIYPMLVLSSGNTAKTSRRTILPGLDFVAAMIYQSSSAAI